MWEYIYKKIKGENIKEKSELRIYSEDGKEKF